MLPEFKNTNYLKCFEILQHQISQKCTWQLLSCYMYTDQQMDAWTEKF